MGSRASDRGQQGDPGLLAALTTDHARRRPGNPCSFHLVREELGDDERARVDEIVATIRADRAALAQSRFSATWLADTLTAHGYTIGRLTVQNHIGFRCRCGY